MNTALKRKFKRRVLSNKKQRLSIDSFLFYLVMFSGIMFVVTQLAIDSLLMPMGKELSAINTEKTYLQSQIRQLEEEISIDTSIQISTYLADKKLNLKDTKDIQTIQITDTNVVAYK